MTHKILNLVLFVALIHAISGAPQAPRTELAPPNSTDKSSKMPAHSETSATAAATGLASTTTEKLRVARAATNDEKNAATTAETLADISHPAVVNKDNTDTTASSTSKEIIRKRETDKHSDEEEEDNSTSSYTKIPPKHQHSSEEDTKEDSKEDTKEDSEEDALPTKESEYEKHYEHERHSRQAGQSDSPKSSSSSEKSTETQTSHQPKVTTAIIDSAAVNL